MNHPELTEAYRSYLEGMYQSSRDLSESPNIFPWNDGWGDPQVAEWANISG